MGNRKALVVGIDDYSAVPLHGCVNDAEDVAAMMTGVLIFLFNLGHQKRMKLINLL